MNEPIGFPYLQIEVPVVLLWLDARVLPHAHPRPCAQRAHVRDATSSR